MNATLSELSIELSGQATFGKINADENNRIAERYKVTAYPTLLIFKNGTFVEKDVGYGSKARIVDRLHRLMPGLNTSLVKPDSDLAPTAQAPPGQGANRSA
jgi:thioredoxin-like negative regulator of GroEL